jgi:hypothetical protein
MQISIKLYVIFEKKVELKDEGLKRKGWVK